LLAALVAAITALALVVPNLDAALALKLCG